MAQAVTTGGTIVGRITDTQTGAAIPGAQLLFHFDRAGAAADQRSDITRQSDQSGRFEVQLGPGFYDVCVMAATYSPECREVLVANGKSIQHDVGLTFDRLVGNHLDEPLAAGPEKAGPGHSLRAADGTLACRGFTAPYGLEGRAGLGVWVREPLAPSSDALRVLPRGLRDFSRAPIHVTLLSASDDSTPRERLPVADDPTVQHPVFDGSPSSAGFVFAIFPLDWIVAGTTIVGERVAVAPNGTRVVGQTRCPISEADVAFWRQKGSVIVNRFRVRDWPVGDTSDLHH